MMLKSVRLHNIRSYIDETISFPEGSTLLSGDIGSGKSTILMAIDFSLFGLKKGELQGSELLRHGKNEGLVELTIEHEGKEIKIRRTLKRSRNISQDAGSIFIDGYEHDMSPSELRARIMELLGYPQPGIFRYTVYTPQEEMKAILFSPETRLDVIRSVFGMDKYSRIKDNSRTLLSEIRSERREHDAFSRDISEKVLLLEEQKAGLLEAETGLRSMQETAAMIDMKYHEIKNRSDSMRLEYQKAAKALAELHRCEAELKAMRSRHSGIASEMAALKDAIEEAEAALEAGGQEEHSLLKKSASDMEARMESLVARKSGLEREVHNHASILERKFCDVCGQAVGNPEGFRRRMEETGRMIAAISVEIGECRSGLRDIREKILVSARAESMRKAHENDLKRMERLNEEKAVIEAAIPELENKASTLASGAEEMAGIEARMSAAEREMRAVHEEKIAAEKSVSRLEQRISDGLRTISGLEDEIAKKEEARLKSARLSELDSWIDSHFVPLADTIEKNVLASIQLEFDALFRQWFSLLMGDQLSVRIDDKFTPVIEQNGYETEYSSLSGGEKTSVALAYRLALNKTINMLSAGIKTKDIIILDEPTDGFSTEQLDRIRDVIGELGLRQVIIVSHEPKIDTFVDNVIRIYKENHVSKVAY